MFIISPSPSESESLTKQPFFSTVCSATMSASRRIWAAMGFISRLGLGADGKRQAGLRGLAVADALFGYHVAAVLQLVDVAVVHEVGEALGVVKPAHARVAEAELRQRVRVHRPRQAAEDEEDEYLGVQLPVNKTEVVHIFVLPSAPVNSL